jgi:hypothetical protein
MGLRSTLRIRTRLGLHHSPAVPDWPHTIVPDVPVDLAAMDAFRVENFPDSGPAPWLDRPDAEAEIERRLRNRMITDAEADRCRKWMRDGYVTIPGLIDDTFLDYVWQAYEESIATGVVTPPVEIFYDGDTVPGRSLNPHFRVKEIRELMELPEITNNVELLLGADATPFQSISGHKASQQAEHSDSIHMTTYPQGYLVAMWIACEDIAPDSGPFVYYPGTHRLPYVYSRDVGIPLEENHQPNYREFDARYTPRIKSDIEASGIEPVYFTAKRGDVLFWHANLLHGGSPLQTLTKTRKALVFHFFAQGCVCYHDLSGGLSWLHGDRPF